MLLLLETIFLALSTLLSAFYWFTADERDLLPLLFTTLACGAAGGLLLLSSRRFQSQFSTREGFLLVTVTWVLFSLFGMLPYLFYGTCSSVADAFLETVSGFTTTGCTILNDIDAQPHALLFWRSLTQWIGGLGIVVFTLALLPRLPNGNIQLFSAEVTGMTIDKLRPTIQATARRLWFIYLSLTLICAFLYLLGGMNVYDAICHALTTLSSGGFSTHQSSIGGFQSAFIEYVCVTFMFITSINFSLFYFVQREGILRLWRDQEFRCFTFIVLFFTAFFVVLQFITEGSTSATQAQLEALPTGPFDTFRSSLFHVVTIMSSTGFQGEFYDYGAWGSHFWLPTLAIMACGGCAGSTAGGLKVLRVLILGKNMAQEFRYHLHPRAYTSIRINGISLNHELAHRTMAFVFLFLIVAVVCVFGLKLMGLDTDTAIGTTISALGNCGPGLGSTGPAFTWAELPVCGKWLMSAAMLVGRLEIFTVLLLFYRGFWRE